MSFKRDKKARGGRHIAGTQICVVPVTADSRVSSYCQKLHVLFFSPSSLLSEQKRTRLYIRYEGRSTWGRGFFLLFLKG